MLSTPSAPPPPPPGSDRFVNFGSFHCVAISWLNRAGSSRVLEPLGDDLSGGCARCFGTSSRLSAWPWQLVYTTVLVRRTAPHWDRRPPPGPGRWRSKLRTPAYGKEGSSTGGAAGHPCGARPQRSDRSLRALLRGLARTGWGVGRASGLLHTPVPHCRGFEAEEKGGGRRTGRSARQCTRRRSGKLRRQLSELGSCLRGGRGRGRRRGSGSFPRALSSVSSCSRCSQSEIWTLFLLPRSFLVFGTSLVRQVVQFMRQSLDACFGHLFPRALCAVQAPSGV